MTGSCQKTEAVARLETSYLQRQLPELKEKGADHFSRLSGINVLSALKWQASLNLSLNSQIKVDAV